ncbi:bacteriocin [Lactococcus lactis]|uniref:Bacteriocin n=2 Tax=Lactococcus lactis TaxID=1358 RepID=A0AAQ0R5K4_9LACT|nr:bacteriocin [Lactococcus lactis]TLQ18296.1 bacteriocin [Lactococcus lactis subsp. lactis]MCT3137193.1 bacteriocin [Lactococcus lactis]PAK88714.1 hypothetical protein B8W88_07975 [Lactococcus lactis]PAL03214.1 hypothetical protein B8W91_08075 [Lactococcus lactis]
MHLSQKRRTPMTEKNKLFEKFETLSDKELTNITGGISAANAFARGFGDAQLSRSGKNHFEFSLSKNIAYEAGYTAGLWSGASRP